MVMKIVFYVLFIRKKIQRLSIFKFYNNQKLNIILELQLKNIRNT